jgi:hypothetical protein
MRGSQAKEEQEIPFNVHICSHSVSAKALVGSNLSLYCKVDDKFIKHSLPTDGDIEGPGGVWSTTADSMAFCEGRSGRFVNRGLAFTPK